MSTPTEVIIAKLNTIKNNKNTIRDRLHSDGWTNIATEDATLEDIKNAILSVPTPGKLYATVSPGGTYTIPRGYHPGTGIVVGLNDDEVEYEKYKLYDQPDVTPTNKDQVISVPENYWGLEPFTVKAIPHPYHDVSGVTATKNLVHPSVTFVDNLGTLQAGEMPVYPDSATTVIHLKPSASEHVLPVGKYYSEKSSYKVMISEEVQEELYITPNIREQVFKASDNDKFISKVKVNPIPDTYILYTDILPLINSI